MSKNRTYIPQLVESAKIYKNNLLNTNLLIIFKNRDTNRYEFMECGFYDYNFMHLTGLKARPPITSAMFFDLVLKGTLPADGFTADSWAKRKLDVLPILLNFTRSAKMIGIYNDEYGYSLHTESVVGGASGSMGFVYDKARQENVPNSVLAEDIRKITKTTSQVVAIYQKRFAEKLYPPRPRYVCKGLKSKAMSLTWPDEISEKIS